MCRIAGIISKKDEFISIYQNVLAMCNDMAHGGPDDEGISNNENEDFVFGHRRLALIDLTEAGHQPMYYKDLSIIFNGEIYNYLELKEELIALGASFTTATDTEVILAGYSTWGVEIFGKLEGMFAFALHDKAINSTYLVRDQSGIKPLYYSTQNGKLIFASEVKAFKATDYLFNEDKNWKAYFLSFGHIPHPFTTLKDVFSLPNSCFLKWDHKQAIFQIEPFSKVNRNVTIVDNYEANSLIHERLEKAVKAHLIADAPVGVFLSGGIDSSLLTLIANKFVGKNLKTLSINFAEQAYSEEQYQRIVADKTSGNHTSYLVTKNDLEQHLDEILMAMDQPSNDAINSWFVNKCAKENGLKAVLSGIGADELFGGYPSFKRMGWIRALKRFPKFILRLADKLPSEKLKRIYFLSYENPIGEYLFLRGFFTPAAVSKILQLPKNDIDQLLESFPIDPEVNALKDGDRASWMETNLFMKNQLLKDTDFMSMTHAIEVRVPFLDQELLKAIYKISSEIKFKTDIPKGLLVNSFKDILPEAIWNRPKMGFTFPLQGWLRENKKITDPELYKESEFTTALIKRFKAGKLHWSKAYALYQVFKN
ncbi:asparagine synthase (glutamine-hydrolyzing) [Pedobacter sp. Du54]|uniref:asparagine synthase (glutamine-hydrolyzing) n=1 Tax=Pedobacter anseongensis TaxID=3133439 RepID=UPI0030958899